MHTMYQQRCATCYYLVVMFASTCHNVRMSRNIFNLQRFYVNPIRLLHNNQGQIKPIDHCRMCVRFSSWVKHRTHPNTTWSLASQLISERMLQQQLNSQAHDSGTDTYSTTQYFYELIVCWKHKGRVLVVTHGPSSSGVCCCRGPIVH